MFDVNTVKSLHLTLAVRSRCIFICYCKLLMFFVVFFRFVANVYMRTHTRAHISAKYYPVILLAQGQMLRGLNYFQAVNTLASVLLFTYTLMHVHTYICMLYQFVDVCIALHGFRLCRALFTGRQASNETPNEVG